MTPQVVVFGQLARDLVLRVADAPGPNGSSVVRERSEVLGGKGANQAVGLAQLGTRVALVGVVGDDPVGRELLDQAATDGIDVGHVVRRADSPSGLIVNVVDDHVHHRYLEHLPPQVLLTERDVLAASELVSAADTVVLQLQQPIAAALAASRLAHASRTRVIADGAPGGDRAQRAELLARTDVLRVDAREAELLVGRRLGGVADAAEAAVALRRQGPSVIVMEVAGEGDLLAGPAGQEFLPHGDAEVVDTTGAGDALVAAFTHALVRGRPLSEAARLAVRAAGATTEHAGGRPRLHRCVPAQIVP